MMEPPELQRNASSCNTLQQAATSCIKLHIPATHGHILQHAAKKICINVYIPYQIEITTHCIRMQHISKENCIYLALYTSIYL